MMRNMANFFHQSVVLIMIIQSQEITDTVVESIPTSIYHFPQVRPPIDKLSIGLFHGG